MKPFRFPLQPIRVLREQKESSAQQRFGEAMRVCEAAAGRLQAASEELATGWVALREELAAGVTATELLRTRAWCVALEERQKERTRALETARRAMDQAWRELMLATRDRKALDRYYDKCRRLYDREMQRDEQKLLDELGARRPAAPGLLAGRSRLGGDES